MVESLGGDSVEIGDSELSQRVSTRRNPAGVTSPLSVLQLMREKKRARQGSTGKRISEVELYRKIESIDFQYDPYEWWKLHEGTFPRVATLAKVLFFILFPISLTRRCIWRSLLALHHVREYFQVGRSLLLQNGTG